MPWCWSQVKGLGRNFCLAEVAEVKKAERELKEIQVQKLGFSDVVRAKQRKQRQTTLWPCDTEWSQAIQKMWQDAPKIAAQEATKEAIRQLQQEEEMNEKVVETFQAYVIALRAYPQMYSVGATPACNDANNA